ncbi:PmbA/TldA family metallopeptidase, partial [Nitrosococcus oceani]
NIEQGVGVRAISGEKTGFAYSDDISMPALVSAAQATRAIANQGAMHSVQIAKRNGVMDRQTQLYLPEDPIVSLRDAEKVALLEKIER